MKGQNTHRWLFTLKKPVLGPPNRRASHKAPKKQVENVSWLVGE